ncbi:hypothetical protein [Nocardioides sp. zg-1230]|uniref:hypothetical protein n=1 Tax=Nocardioides sp. zg-1230 TaxID=2736601 RepID=UPI001557819F|nr:hypothetical protein [Nocardioides sp. zg-1230]NPC40862.1 hypothetical protein [Nocardioides sp. zg-1230]NPC45238.1 hypothetical protein [Nocardioides sp. zg-1230]
MRNLDSATAGPGINDNGSGSAAPSPDGHLLRAAWAQVLRETRALEAMDSLSAHMAAGVSVLARSVLTRIASSTCLRTLAPVRTGTPNDQAAVQAA